MKAIEDRNEGCLGVVAEVVTPGVISSSDEGHIADRGSPRV
jgi:hypothetical protein